MPSSQSATICLPSYSIFHKGGSSGVFCCTTADCIISHQAQPSATAARPAAAPVFKSIDESSEVESSEVPTDSEAASSPVKKALFSNLNLAESLDEQSHLLEGSESEQAVLAAGCMPKPADAEELSYESPEVKEQKFNLEKMLRVF